MRKLRELEDVLIRAESALAVVLVMVMLALAGYNVVYRNVLVPLQQHWAHSGPPRSPVLPVPATTGIIPVAEPEREGRPSPKPAAAEGADDFGGFGGALGDDDAAKREGEEQGGAEGFGGFGGGLGDDEVEAEPEAAVPEPEAAVPEPAALADDFGGFGGGLDASVPVPVPAPADEGFGGFGGGLGDDEPKAADAPAQADAPAKGDAEGFGGFGGGLGAEDGVEAKPPAGDQVAREHEPGEEDDDGLGEDDLGDDDQFANLAQIDSGAKKGRDDIDQGGPPPEGSFAAQGIAFIDAIKLDWIDIFLRQLVIIVSFLGAMLATQRGKHINIDALSKVLPGSARRVIAVVIPLVAVLVCLVLARAGYDLVQISREFPKELLPWAEEWTLQLMFPVGFGLLAFHFGVRVVEAVVAPSDVVPPAPVSAIARPELASKDLPEELPEDQATASAEDHGVPAEPKDPDDPEDDAARPQGGKR